MQKVLRLDIQDHSLMSNIQVVDEDDTVDSFNNVNCVRERENNHYVPEAKKILGFFFYLIQTGIKNTKSSYIENSVQLKYSERIHVYHGNTMEAGKDESHATLIQRLFSKSVPIFVQQKSDPITKIAKKDSDLLLPLKISGQRSPSNIVIQHG